MNNNPNLLIEQAVQADKFEQPILDTHPNLSTWIELWINYLFILNFSTHTVASYRTSVNNLAKYLTKQQPKFDINQKSIQEPTWIQCDKRLFTRYIAYRLDVEGLSPRSAKQEVSAIRKFYGWMVDNGYACINPTTGYQLNNIARPLPTIADIDLLTQLLDQEMPEDAAQARLWVRDKAMFEMLYGSGLRVSELVNIDVTDIDLQEKKVRVVGKGNKTRVVPITNKSIMAIQTYLELRYVWITNNNSAEMALFISERRGKRLSTRTVQHRLKLTAKRAGIAQNLYPHLLRHCFASHLLSDSGDLRAIQEMLGHTDVSTTQVYTQVDFAKLTQTYDSMHPRARRKKDNN